MRNEFLPLSKPTIGPEEIAEVVDSLESGWITTGPKVQRFEELLADVAGAKHAVAMNSGTAALHVSLLGLDIGPGDEVITTPITFAATVNMILAVGARPVLVDVDRTSLNINPELVAAAVTPATRAIMPVHFAGLPCDLEALGEIAKQHGLDIIEDAAHAIGTLYRGKPIGALSKATEFSFHPIK
ncbi:MAG: DegT/DnrJ/EryC1/StrS aminotransferase family protein, partial [Armatimonadia bacterium]